MTFAHRVAEAVETAIALAGGKGRRARKNNVITVNTSTAANVHFFCVLQHRRVMTIMQIQV